MQQNLGLAGNSIVMDHQGLDQSLVDFHSNKTRHEIMENRKNRLNVTCPDLNNVTFTNDPPFDILGR